jgi:probable addiction module antidote protein
MKAKTETTLFDAADYLNDAESVALYLEEAFATEDPVYFTHALGVVARAKGMTEIARKTGLTRESLYKALSKDGNPEFATVLKVLRALDLKIVTKAA